MLRSNTQTYGLRWLATVVAVCFGFASCASSPQYDTSAGSDPTVTTAPTPKGEVWFRQRVSELSSQFGEIDVSDTDRVTSTAKGFCDSAEDDFRFSSANDDLIVAMSLDDEGLNPDTRAGQRYARQTRELLRLQKLGAEAFCPEHL